MPEIFFGHGFALPNNDKLSEQMYYICRIIKELTAEEVNKLNHKGERRTKIRSEIESNWTTA